MKCISEELIQKYIDKEASAKEKVYIISHSADCARCAEKIEDMQQTASQIKQTIGLIDENNVEIPGFTKPLDHQNIIRTNITRIIYAASAACIILLLFFIFQKQNHEVKLVSNRVSDGMETAFLSTRDSSPTSHDRQTRIDAINKKESQEPGQAISKRHSLTDLTLVYSFNLESEFNANLPISEQEMVIQIIDPQGKVTKY